MTLLAKKIRREASRNGLMTKDLENAVEAITRQYARQYLEAAAYKEAVKYDSVELWEVAGDIVQAQREGVLS